MRKIDYGSAIHEGFTYLLSNYQDVFVVGQGLWSPWYVGNTMTNLENVFGKHRVIDTPVSESAVTGLGVGAAISGLKPIVVHPRMDFMLYAMDSIVNEAAKWSYMFGGQASAGVTIRAIINRGGEQGAQHSQDLHSWFSHIPGLRVVMPFSPSDARDLLIASVLSNDPVIFIDDRWLYSGEEYVDEITEIDINEIRPKIVVSGDDLTIVGCGYTSKLAIDTAKMLQMDGYSVEVIDLRVLNPFQNAEIVNSVRKTGRLLALDGGWLISSMSSEVIASVAENIIPQIWKCSPKRIGLPFSPAPASKTLEDLYYPHVSDIFKVAKNMLSSS